MEDSAAIPSPAPRWRPASDPLFLLIVGLYLALAVGYSFVMELGFAPDETTRHYPYVQWLAAHRTLPPPDLSGDVGPLNLHPPLYYVALTPVYLAAHPYGNRAALQALRLTSPFLILAALLLWFACIRKACADDRATTLGVFALTAWWPNLYVDAGALNNDVGAILVSSFLLYLVSVRHWDSRSLMSAAIWGLVVGLGALTKSSVLTVCLPVVAVALVWQHGRRFYADGRFWTRGLLFSAVLIATCAWWYLRNLEFYHALVPVPQGYSPIPPGIGKLDALMFGMAGPLVMRAVNGLWVSVFAGAVWFPDWTHPVVYGLLRVVSVAGIIGAVVGLWRLAKGRMRLAGGQLVAIVLPVVGFAAIYLSTVWVAVFVHAGVYQGGRYLMPFLPGLTIPLSVGLRQLVPTTRRADLAAAVAVFFLALNFLVWYHLITYWNPFVLGTAGRFH
jgi:hypothetical protein